MRAAHRRLAATALGSAALLIPLFASSTPAQAAIPVCYYNVNTAHTPIYGTSELPPNGGVVGYASKGDTVIAAGVVSWQSPSGVLWIQGGDQQTKEGGWIDDANLTWTAGSPNCPGR